MTVAAMLLHSIFGCSLHHACACETHEHGEHQHVAEVEDGGTCDHDHGCHHHDHACDDEQQKAGDDQITAAAWVSNGCDCCEQTPCEHGDSPCCTELQCSFILASDVEFSLDVGPALFVLVNIDPSWMESLRARNLADVGRLHSGFDDSLSRCALHCSWQI
jgi:hypothetical protein